MHSLLERQLKRAGIDEKVPPDADSWADLLEYIGQAYEEADESRYLLERSLDVATQEMETINKTVEAERDKLKETLAELEEKNRHIQRANEFFRSTLDHLLDIAGRGIKDNELLIYLRHVNQEFDLLKQ